MCIIRTVSNLFVFVCIYLYTSPNLGARKTYINSFCCISIYSILFSARKSSQLNWICLRLFLKMKKDILLIVFYEIIKTVWSKCGGYYVKEVGGVDALWRGSAQIGSAVMWSIVAHNLPTIASVKLDLLQKRH